MQWIAMLTMLIDHVGLVFSASGDLENHRPHCFPNLRLCSRSGHRYTSSRPKYIIRLAIIAVISQIPYQLALDPEG